MRKLTLREHSGNATVPDPRQNQMNYKDHGNRLLGRYIIPDKMLSFFGIETDFLNSFSQQPYSHFINEKTEPEEAEKLVQGHSAGKWQSEGSNLDLPNPKLL